MKWWWPKSKLTYDPQRQESGGKMPQKDQKQVIPGKKLNFGKISSLSEKDINLNQMKDFLKSNFRIKKVHWITQLMIFITAL